MVAVDRRRDRDPLAPGLHELQHAGLPEHVLKDDAVGPQRQVADPGLELGLVGVVEVSEQELLGRVRGRARRAADDPEIAIEARVRASSSSWLAPCGRPRTSKMNLLCMIDAFNS
jgi:hypothetical protein